MAEDQDPRLRTLSSLIQVERQAREAESLADLAFVIVNDSLQVLDGRMAVLWQYDALGRIRLVRASHTSEIDKNAPFSAWLEKLIKLQQTKPDQTVEVINAENIDGELREEWSEYLAPHLLSIPLTGKRGLVGGLLVAKDAPWAQAHLVLGEYLASAFGHAWDGLLPSQSRRRVTEHLLRNKWRYGIAIILLFLIPVRQYVLAEAEVVAMDPYVVAAPVAGVIKHIEVAPNQLVSHGDLLFQLDDTELQNAYEVSSRAYDVAEAELLRNTQGSFECEECRAKVPELRLVVERERAKESWARSQLEKSMVTAPIDGVAVFSDANEWEGRPVSLGEKVITITAPNDVKLKINLSIDNAIAIDPGTEVVFYPNVSPLNSFSAKVTQTSFEARLLRDQTLAYTLKANFTGSDQPRLGWRGTAKLYGGRAPIIYLALRRPISWLRRISGL